MNTPRYTAKVTIDFAYAKHMTRNLNNIGLVCHESQVDLTVWTKLKPSKTILHKFPTDLNWTDLGNVKYVEKKGGRREMIFNSNGNLVTNFTNAGTYNYIGPEDAWGHIVADVIPYLVWGNGPVFPPNNCGC